MRARNLIVLAAAVALIAAACGRDEDPVTAPSDTPTSAPAPEDSAPAPDDPAPDDSAPDPDEAVALADGGFGDLGTVCSPGDAQPIQGVSGINGKRINIGTMADPGFVGRPGLNQEMFDAAEAFVAWCNEMGGVRGYELKLNLRDTDLTAHQARMVEACPQDFFLVGSGVVFDDAGQPDRLECGLPEIAGFLVTPTAFDADIALMTAPISTTEWAVGEVEWANRTFPELSDKVGVMTGSIATTQIVRDRYLEHFDQIGWEVIFSTEYNPLGESNWKPFAQAAADAGVEIFLYVGEPENFAALQKAAADLGWAPSVWLTTANHYDPNYITVGGEAVANTFIRSGFHPLELADENQATADYLELIDTYDPGGKVALLGEQGLSAWLLFATSLGECVDAGTVDRDCVFSTSSGKAGWTGGGLHVPVDVTANEVTDCYLIIEATADGFVFPDIEPTDGLYRCVPEAVSIQTGDYGTGARCPSGVPDPLPSEC